ncbi:exonuclease 3'-5' domain-containing protein 2-like [Topomyia yanbarensis]|uniref:exonuclease 3'-5' domain-containing protein 2-like n=1 Tax=Topomyia yanbarensis TaxID=2498891 RepID=UPI00273C1E08|nr:exonuclease 3'-5' domain-containing protein 2-like [Topomyia yanbarensis]
MQQNELSSMVVTAAAVVFAIYVVKRFFGRTDPLYNQTIKIVTNSRECIRVIETLRTHCQEHPILGLDCEWVSERGRRYPVALLQLATHRGFCALFRLCEMRRIPSELRNLLNDPSILKVGVGPDVDANYLEEDYNIRVIRTLDLRHLARDSGFPWPYGMANLAKNALGITMDKDWTISASDWESSDLTDRQIKYAANDAHVAVELFEVLAKRFVSRGIFTSQRDWLEQVMKSVEYCIDQPFVDTSTVFKT